MDSKNIKAHSDKVFFIEGMDTAVSQKACDSIQSFDYTDFLYSPHTGLRALALANKNNIDVYDPIPNFIDHQSIISFVKIHGKGRKNKDENAKIFDLLNLRAMTEMVQLGREFTKQQNDLKKTFTGTELVINIYDALYENTSTFKDLKITKAYIKAFTHLKQHGYFKSTFKPGSVFSPESYCLKDGYKNIMDQHNIPKFTKKYVGKDLGPKMDLSQYTKHYISDPFFSLADKMGSEKISAILNDNSNYKDSYSILGSRHVGAFHASKGKEYTKKSLAGEVKFKPLHLTKSLPDASQIKHHVFPEAHGNNKHSYNSLVKYIKKQNSKVSDPELKLEIPTEKELFRVSKDISCDTQKDSLFTSKELSFLICKFTPVKAETETSKECQTRIIKHHLKQDETIHCAELMDGALLEDLVDSGICAAIHDEL